jgi:hypothetical protein
LVGVGGVAEEERCYHPTRIEARIAGAGCGGRI